MFLLPERILCFDRSFLATELSQEDVCGQPFQGRGQAHGGSFQGRGQARGRSFQGRGQMGVVSRDVGKLVALPGMWAGGPPWGAWAGEWPSGAVAQAGSWPFQGHGAGRWNLLSRQVDLGTPRPAPVWGLPWTGLSEPISQ